jgi:hypothetical protein
VPHHCYSQCTRLQFQETWSHITPKATFESTEYFTCRKSAETIVFEQPHVG